MLCTHSTARARRTPKTVKGREIALERENEQRRNTSNFWSEEVCRQRPHAPDVGRIASLLLCPKLPFFSI